MRGRACLVITLSRTGQVRAGQGRGDNILLALKTSHTVRLLAVVNVGEAPEIANCALMHYVDTRRYYRGPPYLDTIKSVLTTQWIEIMEGWRDGGPESELKFPMTSHSITWNYPELRAIIHVNQRYYLLHYCRSATLGYISTLQHLRRGNVGKIFVHQRFLCWF